MPDPADLVVAVTDRPVSAFEEGSEIEFAEIDKGGATLSIGKPQQGDVLITPLHRSQSPLHPRSPERIMPAGG
jgi:hypothetical protein